ncbi:hypothetical protein [Clostridium coskatii]|uniref:Uncharacterized protein n=1 Tax=Clostridium coskatii TaxID=1705578 RepID=A0A166RXX1_9CLOT|nr:hypothetical protein [Clostridium coskatii]OAA91340.1 hypothetical protein WX73_01750 [Clostridium coskatii]OBR93972.1 hypothetical protein CLCOS_21080 [Clostridium coskatii]
MVKDKNLMVNKINELISFIEENNILYEIESTVNLIDTNNVVNIEKMFKYILSESFKNNKIMYEYLIEMFESEEDIDIDKIENLDMYKKLKFIKKIYEFKNNSIQHRRGPFEIKQSSIGYNHSKPDEIILTIRRGDDQKLSLELNTESLIRFISSLSQPLLYNMNMDDIKLDSDSIEEYLKVSKGIIERISGHLKKESHKEEEIACSKEEN